MESRAEKLTSGAGAAFIVLINVGNGIANAGLSGSNRPTAQEAAADAAYLATHGLNKVGVGLEILGFCLFIVFLGRLIVLLRERGGVWGMTAVVAGLSMLAVKLGSGVSTLVAGLDREQLSATESLFLTDIGSVAFVLSWVPMGLFVAALASTHLVGRNLRWTGLIAGLASVATGIVGVFDPGKAIVVPFLLCMLWTLVASVRLVAKPAAVTEPLPVLV